MSKKPNKPKAAEPPWTPDRLRDPQVQEEILQQVLEDFPTLTREEAVERLKAAGLY
jgi:hypothetical protein